MSEKDKENTNSVELNDDEVISKGSWSIRPCAVYKDEYDECTSMKARFHQYFIHGESIDCSRWKQDYETCQKYEKSNGNDVAAATQLIRSEELRRKERLKSHYANTTWQKRKNPPEDWAKPLPEWFAKRNENTYLEAKQMELEGRVEKEPEKPSYCSIM